MKQFIEKQLVRILLARSGPYISKAFTALAAYVVAYLATKVQGIENVVSVETLTAALWLAFDASINALPAGIIRDYGKQLQNIANAYARNVTPLKQDGFVGPVTIERIAGELAK